VTEQEQDILISELVAENKRLAEVRKRLEEKKQELEEKQHQLESKSREMEDEIKRLNGEVANLRNLLLYLRKKVFGKMSEKNLPVDPNQLNLFSKEELSAMERKDAGDGAKKEEEVMTRTITVKSKPARRDLDTENLPVKEDHIYPDGTLDADGKLKEEYVEIGTEVSSRIERRPAEVTVIKTIRHKVMAKSDIDGKLPEERRMLTAPMPLMPVSKSMAGASVLADIIIGKFMYHLPFYRQIQQYKESGISISASTMGGWYEAAVEKLKLLYDVLRRQILESGYIEIDESVIPVLDDEKHKAKKGYEWAVRDGITGDVMFYYDRGRRSQQVAKEMLADYNGIIQVDGYEVYDYFEKVQGITVCGCWAHARRKFVEALDENKTMASAAIGAISQLYKVESDADEAGLTADERQKKRQAESYPVIKEFEKWMQESYTSVAPSSRMGRAIQYTYSLLPRLARYVNDGRVCIDNNPIENAIRPLAIGRKNYLFCSNDASAYRAAIAYSLIGTCKAAGVDPRAWMEDVLRQLPYYQRDGKDLAELLPRAWKLREENTINPY